MPLLENKRGEWKTTESKWGNMFDVINYDITLAPAHDIVNKQKDSLCGSHI